MKNLKIKYIKFKHKKYSGRKNSFFNKWFCDNWLMLWKNKACGYYLTLYTKNTLQVDLIFYLNMKMKLKFYNEMGEYFYDLGARVNFFFQFH